MDVFFIRLANCRQFWLQSRASESLNVSGSLVFETFSDLYVRFKEWDVCQATQLGV